MKVGKAETIEDKFWRYVDKKGVNEWWNWLGNIVANGYGRLYYNNKSFHVHRLSYIIHFGEIDEGKCVCHKCDNKKCINSNHLFLGTQQDNIKDRDMKNRQAKGETSGKSKLTNEIVQIIREKYTNNRNLRIIDLAKEYKLDRHTIGLVINNEIWKDKNYQPKIRCGREGIHRVNLTYENVFEIRNKYLKGKIKQSELARDYGVSQRYISLIVRNEIWADDIKEDFS